MLTNNSCWAFPGVPFQYTDNRGHWWSTPSSFVRSPASITYGAFELEFTTVLSENKAKTTATKIKQELGQLLFIRMLINL